MTTSTDGIASPVIAIAGPTAAGKSALALELVERLDGKAEIVSVDSAQVYRGMDIGTAKPDAATRARVPHHLLDILDPAGSYSAARFAEDAQRLVAEIRARGRVPLLVGGTLLYFRALFEGLSDLPPADPAVRAQLEREFREHGLAGLYARLHQVDPATAERLHPNDAQRIRRALEIHDLAGEPASRMIGRARTPALGGPAVRIAVLGDNRDALRARIALRFERMIECGLLDEVARLHARGDLHPGLPAIRAVGYRQLWRHLDGEVSLAQAIQLAITASCQYAKRQLTWLRSEPQWRTIDPTEPNALERVLNMTAS